MANKTIETLVKCPFFAYERGETVACEGMEKNTCMVTKFACAKDKHAYLRAHCYHEDGCGCFLADGLYKKYETE